MKHHDLDISLTPFDMPQLADALSAPGVKIITTIDLPGLRGFVCEGDVEGRFVAIQNDLTGSAFVVQGADIGESIYDQAREVLTA